MPFPTDPASASDQALARSPGDQSHLDHRKRKRNRTSKSCINCRMSKRMCDRQRPACRRCVQLGISGLCAFEVDDSSPTSSDAQEENQRLRRRIAELERVIRELQKKPHPRWASSGLPTDLSLSFLDKDDLVSDSESDSSNRITLTLPSYRSSPSSPPSSATTPLPSSGCTTPLETMMDHPSQIAKGLSTQFPFPVMSSSLDMSGLPLADQGMEQLLWAMMKNTQTAPFDVDMNMFDMASYDNALFDSPAIMRPNRPISHKEAASQRGRIH
ncbi:hypothetical protein SISNIDRAFT_466132 [Sistotremastrum niveocremeum HHB9708]|uniref:Zn(2)-C6 fungal-type domain-containing protein n=1 Tax=Sistotremastrum niveocremeum HHB9708 TaxID=1314777 RepID=A0A164UM76_9AGAM|nr:hypothetical protein SISNIDRAFT_466132 [Sistotremastrum niveocremeum HHB9708]